MKPGQMRGDPLAYLDAKIRYWRGELPKRIAGISHPDKTISAGNTIGAEKAIAYIDAYQTMRIDLFGELLEYGT